MQCHQYVLSSVCTQYVPNAMSSVRTNAMSSVPTNAMSSVRTNAMS